VLVRRARSLLAEMQEERQVKDLETAWSGTYPARFPQITAAPNRVSAGHQGPFRARGRYWIEPATSSVSGINTVLSPPPLSTKTVRGRPPMSAHIRGRCHAI